MSDKKEPVQVMHNWLWVIIPYSATNQPLFAGYCKQCQNYYTEVLVAANMTGKGIFRKTKLPKWGCINPMEGL